MKRVSVFLFLLVVMVGGFMANLFNRGISLRPATLIKPSEMTSTKQVAQAVVVRLYPEMQSKKWMIYNPKPVTDLSKELLFEILREVKKTPAGEYTISERGASCETHCVFIDDNSDTHFVYQERFASGVEKEGEPIFRLQVIRFSGTEAFPPECDTMQRLDERCIHAVSIRSALRKMKDTSKKYFFLKKYNHNQYYLFVPL